MRRFSQDGEPQGNPAARSVDVIKLNPALEEQWRYPARVLHTRPGLVIVEAFFDRSDVPLSGLTLSRGDRFVEAYFGNRWYNIFEVYAAGNGRLKGWYCNISRPAEVDENAIRYVDLALDLVALPEGEQHLLDADEFEQLNLARDIKQKALAAVVELQTLFTGQPVTFRVTDWLNKA